MSEHTNRRGRLLVLVRHAEAETAGASDHARSLTARGHLGASDVGRWLAEQGRVDPDRLCIRGGSAGGYTTLAALAFRDTFAAGASHYGVADLEALATETHKFESRYLDGLIGPWPEARDVYEARSPIFHTDGIDRPLAVFAQAARFGRDRAVN